VLTKADGTVIGKALAERRIPAGQSGREASRDRDQAAGRRHQGRDEGREGLAKKDKDAAIAKYKDVAVKKCLFPKQGKDAANELKKLGVTGSGTFFPAPVHDPETSARIEATLKRGLAAENASKYPEAGKIYEQARRMDPADPAPPPVPSASCTGTTSATGTKRSRSSTRILAMPPIRCHARWRCTGWARSRSTTVSSTRAAA
jgi:hypothetical protein